MSGDRLTTTEAAALTGRQLDTIRHAILQGRLPGIREDGRWWVEPEAVLAWHRKSQRHGPRRRPPAYEGSARLIAEYHSLSAEELSDLAGIHVGNARKHLVFLARQGRVVKLDDGQWVLTDNDEEGVA